MLYKTFKKKQFDTFMKIMAFWGVMLLGCILLDIHQHFGRTCCPHLQVRRIKMEAGSFSSTLVNLCQNIQCHILEG